MKRTNRISAQFTNLICLFVLLNFINFLNMGMSIQTNILFETLWLYTIH